MQADEIAFDLMASACPDGVLVLDPERRVVRANAAARDLLGEAAAPASTFVYAFSPGTASDAMVRHGPARVVPVAIHASALPGETGFLLFVRDTSERLAQREALRRSEAQVRGAQRMEALGALAAALAHDYNNLLTVIVGRCELLARALEGDEQLTRHLQLVQTGARRASVLTRQYLALSQRQGLDADDLSVAHVLEDVAPIFRATLGEAIELDLSLAPDLGYVRVYRSHLEQVLTNLILNARDAMPRGGRLRIEADNVTLGMAYCEQRPSVAPGAYVRIAVSDTGVGMEPELQSHAFEPFFTTKGPTEARGLGLATVYGIVKESGGNVWVYSEAGEGTTIKVYLPRVEAADVLEPEPREAPASAGGETILVVEDETDVRVVVRAMLEDAGYGVLEARNGAEGLRVVEQYAGDIHLVVADVVMPRVGGSEMARQLAEARPDVPVLFISGYTRRDVVKRGLIDETAPYLSKPFESAALLATVRALLDTEAETAT